MTLRDAFRPVLGLTWREHIGGRWAVSLLGFAMAAPVLFAAVFANVQDLATADSAAWVVSSAGSLLLLGLLWWLASGTVLRHRRVRPVAVWVVMLVGAVTGAARSVTATWLSVETGAFEPLGGLVELFVVRAMIGAAQGAVGLPALAFALSILARYRHERTRLLGEEAALRERQATEEGASRALQDALAGPVQQRLRDIADRLGDDSGSDIPELAQAVRAQAHDLWSQARDPTPAPRVRFREVLVVGVHQRPLPLAAVWVVWFPTVVLSLVDRVPVLDAILVAAAGSLVVTGVFRAGSLIVVLRPHWGIPVFLVGTLGGSALAGVVMWLLSGAPPLDRSLAQILASILWLTSATLVVSVIEAAVRRSQEVLDEIRDRIEDDEVLLWEQQRARATLTRDLASVLHGVVQGRLVAAGGASDAHGVARQALREGIERIDALGDSSDRGVEELVQEVSAPWSALMEIDITTSGGVIPGSLVRDVGDVIDECLTNAFRHGASTHVSIEAAQVDDAWELTVCSDGARPGEAVEPGMGTSLLDAVSGGQWHRTALPEGGCEVWVRLAPTR